MLYEIISDAVQNDASDIHLTTNQFPVLRIHGELTRLENYGLLSGEFMERSVSELLTEENLEKYKREKNVDVSFVYDERRFRVHIFRQQNTDAIAMRLIYTRIPTLEELNLPGVIRRFVNLKNGLVLVTGTAGSGKSTTLASLINEINIGQKKHIITIEDPIEYIYGPGQCIIKQREVGQDVNNFADAVRSAMREDPDVVLVGEMRDLETIQNTITLAETGHLVFATLHTKSAMETVDRIIDVFPAWQQQQVRLQLSNVLEGVVSQLLVPKIGGGRVPACEVMFATDAIRSLIRENGAPSMIADNIQTNYKKLGSQTLAQGLALLYCNKLAALETVLSSTNNPDDVKRMIAIFGGLEYAANH
jgi:twitching motility protein PilT